MTEEFYSELYNFVSELDKEIILNYYYNIHYNLHCDAYLFSYITFSENVVYKPQYNSISSIYLYENQHNNLNNYYLNNYNFFNYSHDFNDYCHVFSLGHYHDYLFKGFNSSKIKCRIDFIELSYVRNSFFYEDIFASLEHRIHPWQVIWKRGGFSLLDELYHYYFVNVLEYNTSDIFSTRNLGIFFYFQENTDNWEMVAEAYLPIWNRWDIYSMYAEFYHEFGDLVLLNPSTATWHLVKVKTIAAEDIIFYNDRGDWYVPEEIH